jgi:hypothetical protein
MKIKYTLNLLIVIFCQISFSQNYYLHCGTIVDTKSGKEFKNKTIVISKNKIAKIEDGFITKAKEADIEVDLKNK